MRHCTVINILCGQTDRSFPRPSLLFSRFSIFPLLLLPPRRQRRQTSTLAFEHTVLTTLDRTVPYIPWTTPKSSRSRTHGGLPIRLPGRLCDRSAMHVLGPRAKRQIEYSPSSFYPPLFTSSGEQARVDLAVRPSLVLGMELTTRILVAPAPWVLSRAAMAGP